VKTNWTVPHCGSVLPICRSLRPVGSRHISCLAAREQTSAVQIAKASPPYNMKYFNSFLALSFNYVFIFLTEAAQYECSYRRTAHHGTGPPHPPPHPPINPTLHAVQFCERGSTTARRRSVDERGGGTESIARGILTRRQPLASTRVQGWGTSLVS